MLRNKESAIRDHNHESGEVKDVGTKGVAKVAGNVAVACQLYKRLGRGDLSGIMRLFRDEAQVNDVSGKVTAHGRDGIRSYYQRWLDTLPGARIKILDAVEAGDRVIIEFRRKGTYAGRKLDLWCCDIVDLRDRRIVRIRSYYDIAALREQLNVEQAPQAA